MLSTSEDNLICDFAETYGILDYKALPVSLVATLAAGLRDDSRCKMALSDTRVKTEHILLAAIVDRLSILLWSQSKDARHGRNRPKSIVQTILSSGKADSSVIAFDTAEDFEAARQRIVEEVQRGD